MVHAQAGLVDRLHPLRSTSATGGSIARTFTIQNSGTGNLTIPASGFTERVVVDDIEIMLQS